MKRRTSLAVRITAVCLVVAGVAVAVAGVVAFRLVGDTAREVTADQLSDQADVVSEQLQEDGPLSLIGLRRVTGVLRGQGIDVVLIGPGGAVTGRDPDAVAAVRSGPLGPAERHSDEVDTDDGVLLVETRVGQAGGFALVQRAAAADDTREDLLGRVLAALGVGLVVAVLAGVALARFLARPLQRSADAARQIGAGRRDVQVPVEGPREVADVATAVNDLAAALHRSEAREREFLLSVSHELRTPLTAVRGFAESLADGVATGDDVATVGRTIDQEARRLERLVDDLLDLARLGAADFSVQPTPIDLRGVVTEAAGVWTGRCEREGVELRTELPDAPVVVSTDARRIRQVLDSLAENALRVTPSGAPIVLALLPGPVLEVRDGGPGLRPEDYPVAFDRGTLHARYRGIRPVGTGLGLAIVRGLVERLGGTVTAGPAPEGGARFTVTLPS